MPKIATETITLVLKSLDQALETPALREVVLRVLRQEIASWIEEEDQ